MNKKTVKFLVLISLLSLSFLLIKADDVASIPLDHKFIQYEGIWFPEIDSAKVIFNRHTSSVLEHPESGISASSRPYAYTQTGIRIRFKTSSPTIILEFQERENSGTLGLRNGFGIYADSVRIAIKEKLSFAIKKPKGNSSVLYEIVLPSLHGVNFTGLKLNKKYALEKIEPIRKPTYAAIGNSITHGTGQQSSSFFTYPFVLAREMGWNLYNLAVAGAQTGWPIALLFKNKNVDYITIALGFNDWMWDDAKLSLKRKQYNKLLDTLRYWQPEAKIFCITPLKTTKSESQFDVPFSLQDYREMSIDLIKKRRKEGDKNTFVISGNSISEVFMLADGIHLNIRGADQFARNLEKKIRQIISPSMDVSPRMNRNKLNYKLQQNYPNPFNQETNIEFTIFKPAEIQLYIINLIGQNIASLYNGKIEPKKYHFKFKPDNCASGIYFYSLKTKNFTETKTMTILK
ncbi:MAG: T9SS type A sorting domain-containing protein [Candidatus Marinimicrobia bacterium]|nr:T9SS type A sorting domain-containing protein [Candidatus Neomarinimicrobiota bacterium]